MLHVVWLQSALDELAAIWLQADSALRQAITAASHTIDQRLSSDPLREGESRAFGVRIFFAPPLAVTYQVVADIQTVVVLHVRMLRRRRR